MPFSEIDFQSNYLDRVDLATYHIIFYMLPIDRELTFDAIDPNKGGAIIAESGVTGQITIDNLYSRSYTAESAHHNKKATMQGQKITFTLKEHQGSGLFDKIRYTARQLGNSGFNVETGLYYLEISFRANNYPNSSDAIKLPMVYRWPFRIQTIVAQVTPAGATYDVVGYHEAQTSLTNLSQPNGTITLDQSKAINAKPTTIAQQTQSIPTTKYSAAVSTKTQPKQVPFLAINRGQDQYAARVAALQERSSQAVQSGVSSVSNLVPVVAALNRSKIVVLPKLRSSSSVIDFNDIKKSSATSVSSRSVPPDFIPSGMDLVEWQRILASDPELAQVLYDAENKEAIDPAEEERVRQQEELAEIERLGLNNQVYDPAADPRNLGGQSLLSISVGSVGTALEILAQELTERSKADGMNIEYNIVADNIIHQMKMRVDAAGDQGRWTTMNYNEAQQKWVFTWAPGTSIDTMINDVILSSPDYQAYSINNSVANGQSGEPDGLKKIHKITSTSYNDRGAPPADANDVAEIQIVVESQSTYVYVTKEDQTTNPQSLARSLSNNGQLRKRYFYLFTGLNDQIINLDLKFDYAWYINSPIPNYVDTVTPNQSGTGEVKPIIKPEVKLPTNENTAAKPFNPAINDVRQKVLSTVTATPITQVPLLSGENPAVPVAGDLLITDAYKARQAREETARKAQAELNQRQAASLQQRSNIRFVEDAFAGKTSADIVALMSEGKPTTPRSIFNQAASTRNPTEGTKAVSQPKGRGRPFVNSLFAAAFNATGDLANIEMKIKGDPYWLGHSGTTSIALPSETGVPYFVLSIKNQELYDITTGLAIPSGPYADGLYQVKMIDSEFIAGAFTQTLFACVNPATIDLDLSGYSGRIP